MARVNITRVLLGGLVASIILFIASGIINGAILGSAWQEWIRTMGSLNHAPAEQAGLLIWAAVSLVFGISGVWIYAGIRARYGSGPRTAARAGMVLWLTGWLAPALGQVALGAIPNIITIVGCVGGLVAALLATAAGAWLYREP